MAPAKTTIDIEKLKQALADLKALQKDMGDGSTGAYAKLGTVTDISGDIGPLIDGGGAQISGYYQEHANAVRTALQLGGQGVAAAVSMLKTTIDNYEANEKNHTDAANKTATGAPSSPGATGTKG